MKKLMDIFTNSPGIEEAEVYSTEQRKEGKRALNDRMNQTKKNVL